MGNGDIDHDNAQVLLERKALRNMRALLDKLDDEQALRYQGLSTEIVVIACLIVALIGGAALYVAMKPKAVRVSTSRMTPSEYVESCLSRIEATAKKNRWQLDNLEGRAIVTLTMNPNSAYAQVRIRESSGNPLLDDTFVRLASFAQPCGQTPAAARNAAGVVEVSRLFRVARNAGDLVIERSPVAKAAD